MARRSQARQVAGCWLTGRELVRSLTSGSQVVSSPGRWLTDWRPARAGAADHYFGKESLTSKDHFWKGSCQSLLVWNKEIITL
ncbi:UNVERIFIED_CONTAM: hypothetical protein Slati_3706800 [Sesamum latifolium]|uniref:Uncharacterized protein n=1 Tax=Sesamum latifolium TaxID=2727402 RepID=A0AAW2U1M3_9LAMI